MDDVLPVHKVNSQQELFHDDSDVVFHQGMVVVEHIDEWPVLSEVHHQVNFIYFPVNSVKLNYVIAYFQFPQKLYLSSYLSDALLQLY